MLYPDCLDKTIKYFQKFPGIGEKSAERLALFVLDISEEEIKDFSKSLEDVKSKLHKCNICGNITDMDVCCICNSEQRNKNLICVLEDYKSLFAIEKVGHFNGVYHVLDGLISPIDNIGPDDINIAGLVSRIDKLDNPEIIVALKSSLEGEATTLYIKRIFEKKKVNISRLSYGIPMGAEIDYLDELTLDRALSDRKIISD